MLTESGHGLGFSSLDVGGGYSSRASSWGSLEVFVPQLFDVDVFEREDGHGAHETVGAVDIPHPHVVEGELEVEIVAAFLDFPRDLVGQVEAPFGLDDVAKLGHDIAILAIEGKLGFPVVVVKVFWFHRPRV